MPLYLLKQVSRERARTKKKGFNGARYSMVEAQQSHQTISDKYTRSSYQHFPDQTTKLSRSMPPPLRLDTREALRS